MNHLWNNKLSYSIFCGALALISGVMQPRTVQAINVDALRAEIEPLRAQIEGLKQGQKLAEKSLEMKRCILSEIQRLLPLELALVTLELKQAQESPAEGLLTLELNGQVMPLNCRILSLRQELLPLRMEIVPLRIAIIGEKIRKDILKAQIKMLKREEPVPQEPVAVLRAQIKALKEQTLQPLREQLKALRAKTLPLRLQIKMLMDLGLEAEIGKGAAAGAAAADDTSAL